MLFMIGIMWAVGFSAYRLADRLPKSLEGKHLTIEGYVIGLPSHDDRRTRFDFLVSKPSHDFPKKIRLSWYFPKENIKTGQFWTFTVKLKQPHGLFNPNGFDYEKYLFAQHIQATGYVRNKPKPQMNDAQSIRFSVPVLRQLISDKLDFYLKNSPHKGVIKALTIADKKGLTQQQWDVFRKTGTVHLLAISGLHIGLISGLLYFLVQWVSIRLSFSSPHHYAASAAILIALFYSALAGFSLPTQRSLLMLTVAMSAVVWQRKITASNTLSLTLFVVLIVDPLAVLSVGFWLSFLAVISIVYMLAGRVGRINYWQGVMKVHWITAVGLAPLLLYSFQQVSLISPVANLITVPLISFLVVPLCFILVILLFTLPMLVEHCLFLITLLLEGLDHFLLVLADLPYATISSIAPPLYTIPFALFGILLLMAPRGLPARWVGFIFLLPTFFVEQSKLKQGELTMTLLDVGQGLSVVIETAEHLLVFDTGAKYSDNYNMGDAAIVPFLESKGIDAIDRLVVSHGDNDHKGGLKSIVEQKNVLEIMTSMPELYQQTFARRCLQGQIWAWDQVVFEVIFPTENFVGSKNDNSCVIKVSSNHGSILLTGDIEKSAETWLVEHVGEQLESDILIAPHHGSKTSSSLPFLNLVAPQTVLIPMGYKNKFHFPHAEVVERYKAIGSHWMNTANKGALIVQMKHGLIEVNSSRQDQGKYWNAGYD
jgi:competence protein ComEC